MTRSRVRGCAGARVADRGSWRAIGGRRQATGDRRQATGGRRQAAGRLWSAPCKSAASAASVALLVPIAPPMSLVSPVSRVQSVSLARLRHVRRRGSEAARRQDSFGRRTHRGSRAIDGLRRPAWPSRRPTCSDPGLAITGCIACRRFPGECRAASRCTAIRVRCPNVRPCRFSPDMKRRWCMPTPDSRTVSWPDSACERATAASGRTWRRTRRPASRRRSMPGCAPRRRIGVDNVDDIEND
ncbi:Uncharacterised protein [Burkholderia pseudomallei]|nr:Uncharacterised protein [Burkholderia pseudomallei]